MKQISKGKCPYHIQYLMCLAGKSLCLIHGQGEYKLARSTHNKQLENDMHGHIPILQDTNPSLRPVDAHASTWNKCDVEEDNSSMRQHYTRGKLSPSSRAGVLQPHSHYLTT
jgi:hypothetical protein